ncbi:radical SAM protein [Candidatus Woesearchaeota archaeon]|nr:radical SAM protein [Candidatus Woesearchaeota archaeon]
MIALINPNIVMQKDDLFGTGIPYLPVELAYVAATLRQHNIPFKLIDSFGLNPGKVTKQDSQFVQGLTDEEILAEIPADSGCVVVYCGLVVTFRRITQIIASVKSRFPGAKIVCIENTQQVTAFSIAEAAPKLFEAGADIIVVGDPEFRIVDVLSGKNLKGIKGLLYKDSGKIVKTEPADLFIKNVDDLPFPAWDLFPLKNYWKLGYAHAPLTSEKYIPLLTSRGCPFGCHFCVIPATNQRRWTPRSAKNVVDEMEQRIKTFGVTEFHIEDLNPTIRKERMIELSKEILARNLKVSFKFGAGTKIETLDEETIDWMAKAGLKYLSCSPESGSPKVLKAMDKPFNHQRALDLIRRLNRNSVTTQACFVLGYLNETDEDRKLTKNYIKELTKAGIDEVALFIMTPIPGTYTFDKVAGYDNYSQLTFSPRWRADFKALSSFRIKTYAMFLLWKLRYHPIKLLKQPFNFVTGRFNTKMEMTAFRWLKVNVLSRWSG